MDGFQRLLKDRGGETREALAKYASEGVDPLHKMDLKVSVSGFLHSPETQFEFRFRNRTVIVASRQSGVALSKATKVTFSASGFENGEDAMRFGMALRDTLVVLGTAFPLGVDIGDVVNEYRLSTLRSQLDTHGATIRNEVDGLNVYPDVPHSTIRGGHMSAQVLLGPDNFVCAMNHVQAIIENAAEDQDGFGAALLINAAEGAVNPVGRITQAIAAIEMLAQNHAQRRSGTQIALIGRLLSNLRKDEAASAEDREAIANAIGMIKRTGLIDNGRNLIKYLGLGEDILADWKTVYDRRSEFFHGGKRLKTSEIADLAAKSLEIGRKIIRTYFEKKYDIHFK